MPYSFKKTIEHNQKMFLRKIENVVDEAVTLTAEQIVKDLSDTFDKCIDDFYMYETRRYYRHEVGRGTGNGWNLYMANQMKVDYSHGVAKSIHFGWNGNEMAPYKSLKKDEKNMVVSTEHVLDSVMRGIRFDGDGSNYYPPMTWQLSSPISTKYFGTISGSTPEIIFEQILDKMYIVQARLAGKNFSYLYNTMMKKRK